MAKRHPIFDTLALLRDAEPFKPFKLVLSSGQSVAIGSATDMALNPKSDVAFFFSVSGDPYFVNLRSIASVEPHHRKSGRSSSN